MAKEGKKENFTTSIFDGDNEDDDDDVFDRI